MNTVRETFSKEERLCSAKTIEALFSGGGNVFYTSLFTVVWNVSDGLQQFPARTAFSVSKRGFRLAVTRNLIKRRMREAYRKNKHLLYEHLLSKNIKISLFIILRSDKVPDYKTTEKSVKEVINMLIRLL
ncbi:MAG: ribonuclease P protein component [Bacteroidia bacterium]|nr:ribonuclease P protein component [Bacteroidia bacterium]